jgi:hypothetical protein
VRCCILRAAWAWPKLEVFFDAALKHRLPQSWPACEQLLLRESAKTMYMECALLAACCGEGETQSNTSNGAALVHSSTREGFDVGRALAA